MGRKGLLFFFFLSLCHEGDIERILITSSACFSASPIQHHFCNVIFFKMKLYQWPKMFSIFFLFSFYAFLQQCQIITDKSPTTVYALKMTILTWRFYKMLLLDHSSALFRMGVRDNLLNHLFLMVVETCEMLIK